MVSTSTLRWSVPTGARRSRRLALAVAVASALLSSACSSDAGDDGDATGNDPAATETTPPADESSPTADTSTPDAEPTEDGQSGDVGRLADLVADDGQALCDALDPATVTAVVGDYVELRPDSLYQDDRNLCQVFGKRYPMAGVWVYADGTAQQDLHALAADPYEPCRVGDYDAFCQTQTGTEDSFNGWPTVSVPVGSMAVEFSTPDPAMAQELAAALIDGIVSP